MVASSCSICPSKSLHGPLVSIRSEDILAPDVTAATLNEHELRLLAERQNPEQRVIVEGTTDITPKQTETVHKVEEVTTSKTRSPSVTAPAAVFGVPAPVRRLEPDPIDDADALALDSLLFGDKMAKSEDQVHFVGALQASESFDVLVLDYCHWGPNNVLVMKLEGRGIFFLEWTPNRTAEPVIKLLDRIHRSVRAVVCDNAPEFIKLRKVCEELGVEFNPTHLGREEVKGRQEAAVKAAKLMLKWCVDTGKRQMAELEFQGHHLVRTAQFMLNIRASPSRRVIPWHISYRVRPRLDLHVFTPAR